MTTEDDRAEAPRTASRHERAGWRVLLSLIGITAGVVGLLFVVARDAESSRSNRPSVLPTPVISSDEGCTEFASYWLEDSGLSLDRSVVEGLSNCRLGANGTWFVPASGDDPRIPEADRLSAQERTVSLKTRQTLLAQIEGLDTQISDTIQRDLDRIYDPRIRPVTGHIRDGQSISRARSRYTRVVQAYTLAPERSLLAGYVAFLMEKRIQAYETLRAECHGDPSGAYLRTACDGLEDALSVRFAPFPWDLTSSVNVDAYLAHLARTNQIPTETVSAVSPSTGSGAPVLTLAIHRST